MTYQHNIPADPATLDADLLRLAREYDEARATCAPDHPDIDEQIATRYAIAAAIEEEPAHTPAGHVAKLHVWCDMLAIAFGDDAPVPFAEMARSVEAIRAAMTAA